MRILIVIKIIWIFILQKLYLFKDQQTEKENPTQDLLMNLLDKNKNLKKDSNMLLKNKMKQFSNVHENKYPDMNK